MGNRVSGAVKFSFVEFTECLVKKVFFFTIIFGLLAFSAMPEARAVSEDLEARKEKLFLILGAISHVPKPGAEAHDALWALTGKQYVEVRDQAMYRFQAEADAVLLTIMTKTSSQFHTGVLFQALAVLRATALPSDVKNIEQLRELARIVFKPLLTDDEDEIKSWNRMETMFSEVLKVAIKRKIKLKSLEDEVRELLGAENAKILVNELETNKKLMLASRVELAKISPSAVAIVEAKESKFLTVTDNKIDIAQVKRVEDYMKERVIGQPEVVAKFAALEFQNHAYAGQRLVPEVLLLMGQPGTGKDTSVQAYVDGVHGKNGAFHEHMHELAIPTSSADLWKAFGSAPGYRDSGDISPLIRWLVLHSAGRYIIVEKTKDDAGYVFENKEWSPGKVYEGTFTPEQGVLFANEFHNWPKSVKDLFLKQALEKGSWPINNAGKGIGKIFVPITIVFASNEGIGLVTSRELNGERFGKPLTYDQSLEKWNQASKDPTLLRSELTRSAGATNNRASDPERQMGTSEEFLNRLEDKSFCLMRPLSPDDLVKVAIIKLEELKDKIGKSNAGYNLDLEWHQDLPRFTQEYQYLAENNARPIADRVGSLVEDTIMNAMRTGVIKKSDVPQKISIRAEKNENGSFDLILSGSVEARLPIKLTLNDIPPAPMTDAEIHKYADLDHRLNKQVFGVEHISQAVAQAVLVSQEGRNGKITEVNARLPARVFMFLGPSSTGKTEMAKAIAREVFGGEDAMKTINFSQVRTVQDLEIKILGIRDAHGNSIPSDFMKEYDRANGKLLLNADEFANCPKEVLKALYDILREPVVRTFSDGKPRVMSNVMIIMTGNAGEEWYRDIPRDAPRDEQQMAMDEVYRQAMKDPDYRRKFLETYFSEALLNRVGERNIFFFAPLSFKAIRQLTLMKLGGVLENFKNPKPGERGWDIRFLNKEEYEKALTTFDAEGYVLREQGASNDRFLKFEIGESIKATLLRGKVPTGAKVALYEVSRTETSYKDETFGEVTFGLLVNGAQTPLTFKIKRMEVAEQAVITEEEQIITGYHEAAHELVRRAALGSQYRAKKITIIPGVANFGDHWIRYLGVAESSRVEHMRMTRNNAVREIAVLAAGYVAETLITNGASHDAGKINDMQRATMTYAQDSIMKWGLSEEFGKEAAPNNMTSQQYASSLTSTRKALYEREYLKLLAEGETMARQLLLVNYDKSFIPLAVELIERGTLYREDLEQFYADRKADFVPVEGVTFTQRMKNMSWSTILATYPKIGSFFSGDGVFLSTIPKPKSVADIKQIIDAKKRKQYAEIEVGVNLPVWSEHDGFAKPVATEVKIADVIHLESRKPSSKDIKLAVRTNNTPPTSSCGNALK
jgi:ATP-dependent Clp protease ATP-binding subunit ClpA